MKAFQLTDAGVCTFLDREMPVLENEDSVIVEVKAVGICGSDIHSYKGGSNCPVVPGHEVAGIVKEKGANVTKLEIGDHVVLEPLVSCGHCYACRVGRPNVCTTAKCIGCHMDGGMTEYFMYDQAHWHKIPENISWEAATLIEPYTVGAEVVDRGDVMEGDNVLIYGAGPAGLIALDMCKKIGTTVIMSEVVDGRLDRAKKMGADYCINSLKEDVEARVKDITGGEGPNVIIDCAGLPQMLDQFVRMVSFGGRVVLMGVNLKESSYPMLWVSVKEVGIVGSRMQCHKFKPVIENIDDYLSKADLLVTDVFPFEKAEEAFALAAKAAPDTSKVVVKF